jgi:hypothetical protein
MSLLNKTTRVRLLCGLAGVPSGEVGDVVELPIAAAATLVSRGSAVALDTRSIETATTPTTAAETATAPTLVQKTKRKQIKKRRRAKNG